MEPETLRRGYLRKLKTMRRKYFVLVGGEEPQLRYYDSEKKWRSGAAAKRSLPLRECLDVARRVDTKHKFVIALYGDECFCVVLDSERELVDWLSAMRDLLYLDGAPKPRKHVWRVNVQRKGLGSSRNIIGLYNLCLTDDRLALYKIKSNNNVLVTDSIEFPLINIRRCGDSECFFYMEVGRSAVTGAGELWMHTEDSVIAQSIHATVLNAMFSRPTSKDELEPKSRNRSSSATEASKPISVLTRRQTHTGSKSHGLSPSSENTICSGRSCVGLCISPCIKTSAAYCIPQEMELPPIEQSSCKQDDSNNDIDVTGGISVVRERCDSLPSRANTSAPRQNISTTGTSRISNILRPHSMFVHGIGQSPPIATNSPLSPNSGACSTDSAGSSMSIDETESFLHHTSTSDEMNHLVGRFLNLTPDERVIIEEGVDETLGIWQPTSNETIIETTLTKDDTNNDIVDGNFTFPLAGSFAASSLMQLMMPTPSVSSDVHFTNSVASEKDLVSMENQVDSSIMQKADDGYVDMDPKKSTNHHTMSPTGSTSSVMSGTPSSDLRFSEFHLEKVSSYFHDDNDNRPIRAYSVGSRPNHSKKIISKPETAHNAIGTVDVSRIRAFSVGSNFKNKDNNRILSHGTPPHCNLHHLPIATHSNKSSSAPLLIGSSHSNTPCRHVYSSSHDKQEDLMEMDFTNRGTNSTKSIEKDIDTLHHSASMQSSFCSLNAVKLSKNTSDGYVDMSATGVTKSDYVEMKPESSISENKIFQSIPNLRKNSVTDSSPVSHGQPCTPEGYVEMSWKNSKVNSLKLQNRTRVSSLPITIATNSKKDNKTIDQLVSSSASPDFHSSLSKKNERNECKENNKTPPNFSPVTTVIPSPFSSLKRHSVKNRTKNLKETGKLVAQTVSPSSNTPMSRLTTKETTNNDISVESKPTYDFDWNLITNNFVETDDNNSYDKMYNQDMLALSVEESVSDYMEMNSSKLSVVKECNEVCLKTIEVDKDMKQLINNATKVFDSHVPSDLSDYISLNPNATLDKKILWMKQQESVDDLSTSTISASESAEVKTKTTNNSQPITAKSINICRKISVPAFPPDLSLDKHINISSENKESQEILSSNPLANKNIILSNPLIKSNNNISNINQVQSIRKPILVTVTSQIQPSAANFKPIPCNELTESRSIKAGSPKPIESALNRQLSEYSNDNRSHKCELTCSNRNGEILSKQVSSRPGSVNKCKKGNGSSSRPPSVTSQSEMSTNNISRSRPSSVSSDISSTPTNSRPASVTGERENGNRGLHYASLELDNNLERSPRPPLTSVTSQPNSSYAQIDFTKCEELKNSKNFSITKSKN